MWYFAWILGVGLAVSLGILNGMWFEMNHGADESQEGEEA